MLVCEVARGGLPTKNSNLPEKYIVVKSAEHVQLRYILVYVDKANPQQERSGLASNQSQLINRMQELVPVSSTALLAIFYAALLYIIGTIR